MYLLLNNSNPKIHYIGQTLVKKESPSSSKPSSTSPVRTSTTKQYNYQVADEISYDSQSNNISRGSVHRLPDPTIMSKAEARSVSKSSVTRGNRFDETPTKKARATSIELSQRSTPQRDISFAPYYTKW